MKLLSIWHNEMPPSMASGFLRIFQKRFIYLSGNVILTGIELPLGKSFLIFISGFAVCAMLMIGILSIIDKERSDKEFIMSMKDLPTYDESAIESVLHFMKIDRIRHDSHQHYRANSLISEMEKLKGIENSYDPKIRGFSSQIQIEGGFLSINSDGMIFALSTENILSRANQSLYKSVISSPIKRSSVAQGEKLDLAALPPSQKSKDVAEKKPKEASSPPVVPRTTPITSQIEELLRDFQVSLVENGFRVVIPGADLFVGNSRNLASDASSIFSPIAEVAKLEEEFTLKIVGHTDGIKNADQSMQLSLHRAKLVKSLLADMIQNESVRLESSGQGKEAPIASDATLDGRQKNRRIEVFFLK